jgi:hypothetical protein
MDGFMIKKLSVYTLSLLTCSNLTFAAEVHSTFASDMSKTGLFVKLGESYNPVKFDQYLKANGISNVFNRSTLVAFGASGGPANPYHATQSTFSPETQMGYFKHFTKSDKLWGVKFLSNYLGIISTDKDLDSLQMDSRTNTAATPSSKASFASNVTQTSINHELALLAFVGHSFTKSHVYLGAGPSLFGSQSHFYDVTGYADDSGNHVGITGMPSNLSNSKWMWGGAAQMGMTYYINPTWVLDLSYTYAITGLYSAINNTSSPFNNTVGSYSTLYTNNSQRVTAQAVTVSVNKVFSLF